MSRKHGSQRTRTSGLIWPVIVVGALLVAAAVFLFARQGTGGGSTDTGTPQIAVDQQKIDFGYVKFGGTRSIKIAVTNTGDGVLRFEKKPYIEVLEGC